MNLPQRCGLLFFAGALAGCGERAPQALARTGRLGSFRDLVLFERAPSLGGPFFLDRFEVTRADWTEFARTPTGIANAAPMPVIAVVSDDALPVTGIDWLQARAFATWRCCRLPSSVEWWYATTANGRYAFPWGDNYDSARANTYELGLFKPVAVGTFESGRANALSPYDLVGNIAEWTESVPATFFQSEPSALSAVWSATRVLQASPALAAWSFPGFGWSPFLLVQAAGESAPREVLGSDFASDRTEFVRAHALRDRTDTIGLRLCSRPAEILRAVAAIAEELSIDDRQQLRRFILRQGHAEVLRAALSECAQKAALDSEQLAFWRVYLP